MKLLGQLHISFALWTYLTQESKKFLLLQLDPYGKRCDQNTRRQSSCFTFHSLALTYPKYFYLLFICFISSKNNLYIFFLLHCSYSDVSHTLHFFNPVMVQRSKNQTVSWGMVDTSVPWTVGDVYLLLKDSKFTVCSAAWAVNKHFTPLWGPLAAIFAVGFPSYLTGAANDLQSHGWTFMSPPFFLLALA